MSVILAMVNEREALFCSLCIFIKTRKMHTKNVLFVHKGTTRLKMAGKKEKKNSLEIVSLNFGCDVNI